MNQLTLIKQQIKMHNIYSPTVIISATKIKQLLVDQQDILVEVSFDQYEEIIELLKIDFDGNLPVRKGAFTYEQVKHLAEACCIHELHYHQNGEIELDSTVLSMSSVISFAQSKWNGADRQTAIKNAVLTGVSIFGESFAEEVIEQHLSHLEDASIKISPSITEAVAKNGSKAVAKNIASKVTKKAMISSAVAKKTILFLNANVVTGALVTGVLSTIDIARTIKGELSPSQLFKNISNTAASVAGGMIGMILFAGIGMKIPTVSTAVVSLVGGVIGLIIGSLLMKKITSRVLDFFIQDDAVKMLEIFNNVLAERAQQYLLNGNELNEALIDLNCRNQLKGQLREMYAAHNRENFAQQIIDLELTRIIKHRMYLHIPNDEEVYSALKNIG